MFWTGFKTILFCLSLSCLVACSFEKKENKDVIAPAKETVSNAIDENLIKRKIINQLKIDATEKYEIQFLYEYINADTLKDALILVNRRDFAFRHVEESNTTSFFEKTGNTGPYNYIFVQLAGVKELYSTTPVGSNVNYPLKAVFLELTSKAVKDFYVEYRIRNSLQRNYYTIRKNNIHLTFSCPVFDSIGIPDPVVYEIRHEVSPVRNAKDIALYRSKFKEYDPSAIEDMNHFEPIEILPSEDLYAYFIFDEKTLQYKTPMKPVDAE